MADEKKTTQFTTESKQRGVVRQPGDEIDLKKISIPWVNYVMNNYEMPPYYLQANLTLQPHISGGGGTGIAGWKQNADPTWQERQMPHKHHLPEYFIYLGTDPEKPDDLGGTVELWLGEGDDAEPYIIEKPTVALFPKNVVHLPMAMREVRKPYFVVALFEQFLWSSIKSDKLPARYSENKIAVPSNNSAKKYEKFINTRDISKASFFPSHQGKAHVILEHDLLQNEEAPHHIKINMIYGSGIGWGCGDMMVYNEYETRSLPHLHEVMQIYSFFGTDENDIDNLGGTIEFWIGEGAQAKQLIIDKPTVILIPPNTVHLPLYVREVHRPFISMSILNMPLWAGFNSKVFPTGLQYISS